MPHLVPNTSIPCPGYVHPDVGHCVVCLWQEPSPAVERFSQGDNFPDGGKLYRKLTQVKMWKQYEPFECESREGTLRGWRGDFVASDGHGGFYPISAEFHAANYEEVE